MLMIQLYDHRTKLFSGTLNCPTSVEYAEFEKEALPFVAEYRALDLSLKVASNYKPVLPQSSLPM